MANKEYKIEHIQERLKHFKEIKEIVKINLKNQKSTLERETIRMEAVNEAIEYLEEREKQILFSFPCQKINLLSWRDFLFYIKKWSRKIRKTKVLEEDLNVTRKKN